MRKIVAKRNGLFALFALALLVVALVIPFPSTPNLLAAKSGDAFIEAGKGIPGAAVNGTAASYFPGEVLVSLRGEIGNALRSLCAAAQDILRNEINVEELLERQRRLPAPWLVKLPLGSGIDPRQAASFLSRLPMVERAEPNYLYLIAETTPNDPRYIPDQWNLRKVRANQAWDVEKGSDSLTIAVIDTGVDYNHPDISSRCVPGYDYYNGDPNPMDDHGHGTMVASVAAATTNNSYVMAGMCWYGKIMPLKAFNSRGEGTLDAIIQSIYHAANNGANIINMSFVSSDYSAELQTAIDYAYARGLLMFAAVGNQGSTQINYPAGCAHVCGVGSTDYYDNHSSFSNHNSTVDLVAPGEGYGPLINNILGLLPGSKYGYASGTSLSTPHAVGAALLVWSHYPLLTGDQVEDLLEDYAVDLGTVGRDDYYGYGRLDVYATLARIKVEIDSPQPYSFPSSGWVTATATTESGGDITSMELWVDGVLVEKVDLGGSLLFPLSSSMTHTFTGWNFSSMTEGGHNVEVRAEDSEGMRGETDTWYYRNDTHPRPSDTWYLAEGTTAAGFQTYVVIQNPNAYGVTVDITYMLPGGPQPRAPLALPANSRTTICVNAEVFSSDVATYIKARDGESVIAERAMYWNGMSAGHASIGVNEASTVWYLAEGTTQAGFEEWVVVQNPSLSDSAHVDLRFMRPDGSTLPPHHLEVNPGGRGTAFINAIVPNSDVSVKVESDIPVIAERAMYWNNRVGGHESVGVKEPSRTWYLAEGTTQAGFEEWMVVQNPDPVQPASLTFNFLVSGGSPITYSHVMSPNSRYTLYVAGVVGSRDVSTFVVSDVPVIAERAMYWNNRVEGHSSIGSSTPSYRWFLAEGSTAHGFTEYVVLSNPTDHPVSATLSFMLPGGSTLPDYYVYLPAHVRSTINLNTIVYNSDVSVEVNATGNPTYPIIVERAMYWSGMRGGTDSTGALQILESSP